jgi:hypothetical protein
MDWNWETAINFGIGLPGSSCGAQPEISSFDRVDSF